VTGTGTTSGGTIYGMQKTTVYLPDELKRRIEATAASEGRSEAEVIRRALALNVPERRPRPRPGVIHSGSPMAEQVDELLAGFGEDG
jgi:plasmid stability protein